MPSGDPLVSIRCTVYNHEPFLRECLDGFVMQKTNFPFEAIVHDDASTDGSAAIIREYAEKYPDIIKPIYETENQYWKGVGAVGKIIDAAIHPNTKYIAFCEGDDYWTDPNKLQIQVDFLESHPEFVLTSHDYIEYDEDKHEFAQESQWGRSATDAKHSDEVIEYDTKAYFRHWFTQPLTCVYRRGDYREELKSKGYSSAIDDIYFYVVLQHGKGAFLNRLMGVYRRHSGGVWTSRGLAGQERGAMRYAIEIYKKEGDRDALWKARVKFINMVGKLIKGGDGKAIVREIKYYYDNVPLPYFLLMLSRLTVTCFKEIFKTPFELIMAKLKK